MQTSLEFAITQALKEISWKFLPTNRLSQCMKMQIESVIRKFAYTYTGIFIKVHWKIWKKIKHYSRLFICYYWLIN